MTRLNDMKDFSHSNLDLITFAEQKKPERTNSFEGNSPPKSKKSSPWTKEEDEIIILLQEMIGNRWARIATFMNGRSGKAVRNHWQSCLRRKKEAGYFQYLQKEAPIISNAQIFKDLLEKLKDSES